MKLKTKKKAEATAPPEGSILVNIDLLEEPTHMLRPVDEDSDKFKDVVASMKAEGFWPHKPIAVAPDGEVYVVTDGMHRFAAARKAGLTQVWVVVGEPLDAGEQLRRAFTANAVQIETRPVDYARACAKLLELNPGWTIEKLATEVHKSTTWIQQRLRIATLEGPAAELTNKGKIPVQSAAVLARAQRAGVEITDAILERAQGDSVEEFVPDVEALLKKDKTAPVLKLRPIGDVKAEYERAQKDKKTKPGYVDALAWCLRQDPVSLAEKKSS